MANKVKGIKVGDEVVVIAGKDRGKIGEVIKVFPDQNRVVVENINIITRHQRQTKQGQPSGRIEKEAPIHLSNVMVVDPETGEPTRISRQYDEKAGQWVRVTKKSNTRLD